MMQDSKMARDCMGLTNFTDEVAGTAVFVTMMGGRGVADAVGEAGVEGEGW